MTDDLYLELYRTKQYPAFHWMWDSEEIKTTYWNAKWKMLSDIWDEDKLRQMYAEFKKEKWDKMNWAIYSAYHGEEIKRKNKERYDKNKDKILERNRQYREKNKEKISERKQEYRLNNAEHINKTHREYLRSKNITCECGGTYADIPCKKNRHMQTKKHQDYTKQRS